MNIASKYDPSQVEKKWYDYWLERDFFHSVPDDREPYTVVIPPPNVTGILHMGHMLNNTIQDILVRRARMMGKNACWVPGTDHASIATEMKVVNKLAEQGISKTDLSREDFLKHAWDWTDEHGGIILNQLRHLGASCDWKRTAFTMDDERSESVFKVFVDLFEKGYIYRGVRMVNWDPKALTAISDEEVIYKEENNKLYYLKYKVEGEETYAIVATTRPETIMGDTAMCINPNDPKNQHLKGKKVIVPLVNRVIPVIEDDYVDIEFGTGCLKVTPAHDVNDYMLGDKYHLPSINIFNDDATLSEEAELYVGLDRFDVREQIVKDLASANLLEKVEDYTNKVGYSERSNTVIEPKLSMQWFLKMKELAKPALEAVMSDEIKFYPAKYKNTYRHWMENLKDWCISRQLWWGHRIPAYYLPKGGYVVAMSDAEALEKAKAKSGDMMLTLDDLRQDDDCLDTWFSSWLWPISLFDGINNPNNEEINYYYPTADLVTAPDIIFFWVARMVMAGYEYKGQLPFKNVYFTGIVRDNLRRKMSKSLGNSPDPIDLIKKYGADGVRMGMMLSAAAGNDILFEETLCEQGRNFSNKIWNSFRLINGWEICEKITQPESSTVAIHWFQQKINQSLVEVDDLFSKYRISEALMTIYKLMRDEFSSWYLEIIKPEYQKPIDKITYDATLLFFDQLLRVLHPFMPFITEELWQTLQQRSDRESLTIAAWPKNETPDLTVLSKMDEIKEVITAVRAIRKEKNIPNKEVLTLCVVNGNHDHRCDAVINKTANLDEIKEVDEAMPGTATFLVKMIEYAVPLNQSIDKEAELKKIQEELTYLEGFKNTVMKKLNNDSFIKRAPAKVVEIEQRKLADANSKIQLLKENIKVLQ